MGALVFESVVSTLTICNPFSGFAAEEHRVEVRRDPLLGDTSVYNPALAGKAGYFGATDRALLSTLVEESARTCVFCGTGLRERAARYPDALVPGGRLVSGDAVLIPNLFALGAHHAVVVLGQRHFLPLREFSPTLLADGFAAARSFLRVLRERDPASAYATVNANYLMPAGASVVHPHQQLLVTPLPYSYHARLLEACRRHGHENGTSALDDLVREERRIGSRYVAQAGRWHWIAPWAPTGANEITAIHESAGDLLRLDETDLLDLAGGIAKVLALYDDLGHLSFNYTLYTARDDASAAGARCLLKIVSRQNLSAAYRNDDYFLQKLLQTELIVNLPEDLATRLRGAW